MKRPEKFVIVGMVVIIYLLSSCCRSGQNNLKDICVISSLSKSGNLHFSLPSNGFNEKEYYQEFNFIIDSTGSVFYYYLQPGEWGISGGPVFVNLYPGNIVKIPESCIVKFLLENVIDAEKHNIVISIASQKDSIQSVGVTKLYNYIKDRTVDISYYFRTTTVEENVVLLFKKTHKNYDPKRINWDSTKTIFRSRPTIEVDR